MKYICEHSIPLDNDEARIFTLSSEDKANYIAGKLNNCKLHVEFISNSRTRLKKGYFKSREDELDSGITVVSGSTFGCNNRALEGLQKIHSLLWLTLYLLRNCKKHEIVFFYHSVFTCIPLIIVKKVKRIKVIIEIEEMFSDLNNKNKSWWRDKIEKKAIEYADGYIFASDMLQDKCNQNDKPYIIANGKYELPERFSDYSHNGKKVLVYAGLIRNQKVAFKAARIAMYLPSDYEIRIIGYGSERDIRILENEIISINSKSKCHVYFDGTKRGAEYDKYLQKCDFGLCPLTTDTVYQNGCFPSKIISYLSNGLPVYTTKNDVIKNSPYEKYIRFVEDDTPQKFAQCIINTRDDLLEDPRKKISEMDKEFGQSLESLIKKVNEV